jgi:hypothetical protein
MRLMTDTIKSLSDQVPGTTVILVGVADTVDELISEHASIERALVQVRMPRMSPDELGKIIDTGTTALGMSASEGARYYITRLSQGLPHYAHLLGLYSTRAAIQDDSELLGIKHVQAAIAVSIENAQQTLQETYHCATRSQKPNALYEQVLLAAALARTDELGYFPGVAVREPMSRIMGRRYEIAAYSSHLFQFCEEKRGPVLERTGAERRYRYRFRNPLLQPFVIMRGLNADLIKPNDVVPPEDEKGQSLLF